MVSSTPGVVSRNSPSTKPAGRSSGISGQVNATERCTVTARSSSVGFCGKQAVAGSPNTRSPGTVNKLAAPVPVPSGGGSKRTSKSVRMMRPWMRSRA